MGSQAQHVADSQATPSAALLEGLQQQVGEVATAVASVSMVGVLAVPATCASVLDLNHSYGEQLHSRSVLYTTDVTCDLSLPCRNWMQQLLLLQAQHLPAALLQQTALAPAAVVIAQVAA
jgi:hypothetical protein